MVTPTTFKSWIAPARQDGSVLVSHSDDGNALNDASEPIKGVFQWSSGVPQNGWFNPKNGRFIQENPMKMMVYNR